MMIIKGKIISKGYSFGKAFILNNEEIHINKNKIKNKNIKFEILRFLKIYKKTIYQFNKIISSLSDKNKKILFEGYIMILEEDDFKKDIIYLIKNKNIYSDTAINLVIKKYINSLNKIKNKYIKERINDLLDIKKRLLYNLYNVKFINFNFLNYIKNNIIIISKDIFPSQIIQFNLKKIVGFAIELGSLSSHISIIAKLLKLTGIIKVKNITKIIYNNDYIIIDGIKGKIYVNPNKNKILYFKKKNNIYLKRKNY